jgi:hypothetical protein
MGIVQALLMMRHMMFVGYSLKDEDFHELVHEVRAARGGAQGQSAGGTVLTLFDDPIASDLWRSELEVVPMMKAGGVVPAEVAGRQLEMFLDLIAFLSTTSAPFFLDDSYVELTTDEEEPLRKTLLELRTTTANAKPGSVGHSVKEFLSLLG